MAWPKGQPRPVGAGRKAGTPNKLTSTARRAFMATFGKVEGDLETWIRQGAEKDPLKAADLVVRMAEYHFPRLGRTEVTGKDGEPLKVIEIVRETT